MDLHPLHDESFERELLALTKMREADDGRRALRPLRERVLESVLLALMTDREYRGGRAFLLDFRLDNARDALMEKAKNKWMNDPFFHALVAMTVNEILRDADLSSR